MGEVSKLSDQIKQYAEFLEIVDSPFTFEIFVLLVVHEELSLKELTDYTEKSKPTVFRHVQKLLNAGFIFESKEEKVRGSIKAKFYKANKEILTSMRHLQLEDIQSMDENMKREVYQYITISVNSAVQLIKKSLDQSIDYLENKPHSEIPLYIEQPDLSLNITFFTEDQYKKYVEILQKGMMEFFQYYSESESKQHIKEKDHPYFMFHGILPMHNIFDQKRRINQKKM